MYSPFEERSKPLILPGSTCKAEIEDRSLAFLKHQMAEDKHKIEITLLLMRV